MSVERRKAILDEAAGYVCKDRNDVYGEPEDSFSRIADFWNAHLGNRLCSPITPTDVSLMMAGMKLARLAANPEHRDSWVDGAGYLACGGDIALPVEQARVMLPVTKDGSFKGWVDLGKTDDVSFKNKVEADVEAVKHVANKHRDKSIDVTVKRGYVGTEFATFADCGQDVFHRSHAYGEYRHEFCRGLSAAPQRPIKDAPQA